MASPGTAEKLTRRLLLALAGTAAAFVLTLAVTSLSATGIHRAATQIVENASPSVAELAAARTELRHLELLLVAPRSDPRPARVMSERLMATWHRYLALPYFAGEQELRQPAARAMATLSIAVDQRDPVAIASAADALDEALLRLQEFNGNQASSLGEYIRRKWDRSLVLSALLVVLCLLMTASAFVATARLVRGTTTLLEQRANELEMFGSRIAHDIANPVSAVALTLNLIEQTTALEPAVVAKMERARRTLRRVIDLVQGLYGYARSGGQPEPGTADVPAAVQAALDQVRAAAEEARVVVAADPVPACAAACAPGVLLSVLSNLMTNAIKHMGERERREVRVRVDLQPDQLRIDVADTGPGIAPELQGMLFRPYQRGPTGARGLGLGLATVKRLVEAHRGTVTVQSVAGEGSTFSVRLPRA